MCHRHSSSALPVSLQEFFVSGSHPKSNLLPDIHVQLRMFCMLQNALSYSCRVPAYRRFSPRCRNHSNSNYSRPPLSHLSSLPATRALLNLQQRFISRELHKLHQSSYILPPSSKRQLPFSTAPKFFPRDENLQNKASKSFRLMYVRILVFSPHVRTRVSTEKSAMSCQFIEQERKEDSYITTLDLKDRSTPTQYFKDTRMRCRLGTMASSTCPLISSVPARSSVIARSTSPQHLELPCPHILPA